MKIRNVVKNIFARHFCWKQKIALDFIRNNDVCLFSDYGTVYSQATNFQSSISMCSGKSLPNLQTLVQCTDIDKNR